ncbi:MAG: hypothetical protein ACJA0E_001160 [Bermanella sp.]|jgi:hypothetical protein
MKLTALIQPSIHLQIESLYQAFLDLNAVEQTTLMILSIVSIKAIYYPLCQLCFGLGWFV